MSAKNRIGELLREARRSAKMTQASILDRLRWGGGKPLLSSYESGRVLPSKERVLAVLKICDYPVPDWLDRHYAEIIAANGSHMRQVAPRDYAEFIRAWQSSRSVQEVSDKMQMSKKDTSTWAMILRTKGVKLRKMSPAARNDWDALIKLAEDLAE